MSLEVKIEFCYYGLLLTKHGKDDAMSLSSCFCYVIKALSPVTLGLLLALS